MQIRLNLKIILLIILFIITGQIEIYVILMLFAIIHELGHLLVGMLLGFRPQSFNILPIGATIGFNVGCNDYNKKIRNGNILSVKKILIALAGPLTNIIIFTIFMIFDFEPFGIKRELIIYSNILIAIFNLIPIYPLDGGRIIKNIFHIIFGLKKSYTYTNLISNVTISMLTALTSIAILYLKNIAILIILMYLWWLVISENIKYRKKMRMYDIMEDIDINKFHDEVNFTSKNI